MNRHIHSVNLTTEREVVSARQQGRTIASALGFDHHDQIRIATAVSEIARNAFRYAKDGTVVFSVDPQVRLFRVTVTDHGAGIPHLDVVMEGSYRSTTGMGMGILGTKRLMDEFSIDTTRLGTAVEFGKFLPVHSTALGEDDLQRLIAEVARQHPAAPIDELQTQNRELLRTLNELRERKEELDHINAELQDTNRGVVALYAELDERADYLRRASELKSSFLSNMSHEFRTPLNSMLALTRMLLERLDGELTSEQDQQIRFIQRSAKELSEMVDDLLDLAKVEAGRFKVNAKTFDVSELLGALRGMLKPLLAESSLNLAFAYAEKLPPLHTDEQKISQVLRNFISNAIKFTPHGEVRVSTRVVDDEIEFSVTDSGIGISESDQRIIFEEFSQIDSAMQKKVRGTGLGLPLSKKFAELLGGRVEVKSAMGAGSTFSLIVPIVFNSSSASVEPVVPLLDADKKLILIVEDNAETAFIYSKYLSKAGFQAHCVSTVQAAEELITKIRPAAVILDVLLGTETTWDFLREIKKEKEAIPVLVMSVTDDAQRIFGSGADSYLLKPFVPEEMIAEILKLTSPFERIRILMIDDNEVSRYLLRGHIPETRYEVFEARDAREGLRMAQQLMPALIFLDFYMPDLNGAEVVRNIRNSKDIAQTPVVLHSTKVLDAEELEYFRENSITIFPKQTLTLTDSSVRIRSLIESLTAHGNEEEPRV
ncbi:ATP-binding protein [Edaphobacter paludis]|uniref:histidine kinase n=1 Tax=Edaphobacter paludis TaxID=3035702 RepID=A0AAU7D3I1_9BACT